MNSKIDIKKGVRMENYYNIVTFVLEIVIFIILLFVFQKTYKYLKARNLKILNPSEYFPDEEIHTLRQLSYLMMMGLLFVNVFYAIIFFRSDIIYFVIYDIVLSLYVAHQLDYGEWKNRILLILLIPYGSMTFLLFGNSIYGIVTLIHIPVFIYFIKVYYDKFREYTESNGLGITIILLFTIIFISFFITQVVENVDALNSLEMVSNAFTSNGYAVLGTSIIGKITAIILVWGGYLLSGVGTATLAAAIMKRHMDIKNRELKDEIGQLNKKIDGLEDLIKKNNDDEG